MSLSVCIQINFIFPSHFHKHCEVCSWSPVKKSTKPSQCKALCKDKEKVPPSGRCKCKMTSHQTATERSTQALLQQPRPLQGTLCSPTPKGAAPTPWVLRILVCCRDADTASCAVTPQCSRDAGSTHLTQLPWLVHSGGSLQ